MHARHTFRLLTVLLVLLAALTSPLAAQELDTDEKKTLYALGLAISQNLGPFALSEADLVVVQQGMADGVLGRDAKVDLQEFGPKIQEMAQARAAKAAEAAKAKAAVFLEEEAGKEGAVKTASGMIITEITPGTGASPGATDQVTVHYVGTHLDGTEFDSSVRRGQPSTFGLNQVIKCWTEGLQLMKVGGKSRLVCPSDIAYGDQGRPGIPGGATLIFEVELISIGGQ